MVVLRSTTDWAAVSSRRSSARETVISRLPVGATAGEVVLVSGSSVMVATGLSWIRIEGERFDFRGEGSVGNDSFVCGMWMVADSCVLPWVRVRYCF